MAFVDYDNVPNKGIFGSTMVSKKYNHLKILDRIQEDEVPTSLVLPRICRKKDIVGADEGLFKKLRNVRELYIPNTFVDVEGNECLNPFIYLNSIEEIYIEPGNPGYRVVDGCLVEKTPAGDRLRLVFHRDITSFSVPAGIRIVGPEAFYLCHSLRELEIDNDVRVVEEYAFKNLLSLKKLIVTDQLTYTGEKALRRQQEEDNE